MDMASRQRCPNALRRVVSAMSGASSTDWVTSVVAIDQPTMRRQHASSTTARYRKLPRSDVGDVGQPQHIGLLGGEVACDQIRCTAAVSLRLVVTNLRRLTPTSPAAAIRRAMRLWPMCKPLAASST